ncbi:MAG: tRNA (adenine-N(6)-)-methyltransferase [Flavobacteriales bacterium]|nr:MAG: tRNA (adenine-N(6)-)-methyltransferase [Flavobacteriales bacterium]
MNSFQFKQFTIQQNTTAMKVGTDGVLLGAWSRVKEGNLLDIGTGTGLIAIMLAQRNQAAIIDGVEIEKSAYTQAVENVKNCNWSDQINAHHCSIQNYGPNKKYDVIISNPPFFIESTKAPNSERNTARHTDNLSFADLISAVIRLLKPDGIFSLILPIAESKQFIQLAEEQNLFLNKECIVKPNLTKPAKRVLMEFSFQKKELIKTKFTIENETRHHYTKEYISLTKDFYLKF